MKNFTSWTKQQVIRKCPRRFFLRYKAPDLTGQIQRLKALMGVREVAGLITHIALADAVRRIAEGERVSDQDCAITAAAREFDAVVERSRRIDPGQLLGGTQIAEMFNGVECTGEIADWRDVIPTAVANGLRLMQYFGLKTNKDGYTVEAEKRCNFLHRGRQHRFVIDVLVQDRVTGWSVLDWKLRLHQTSDTDRQQVELYQRYLVESGQVPPTRIFGFVVDLVREKVEEHHYRAIAHTFTPPRSPYLASASPQLVSGLPRDRYPASPSLTECGRCPFSSICPESALAARAPEVTGAP
jgi:hypothetical protein